MNAEHLLLLLDELDEMLIWLREGVQPAFLAVAASLAIALGIAVFTRSPALGVTSCVLMLWTGLAASALMQRARDGLRTAPRKPLPGRR